MNLPTEIKKDIIYAKKCLAWIKVNAPGENTDAIEATLQKFEKFLPHMKVAYRLVEAAKEIPKYSNLTPQFLFDHQPALHELIEKYMQRLKSTPEIAANTFLKLKKIEFKRAELLELDQRKTLNGILEIYMEFTTLQNSVHRCLEKILGQDKCDAYYSLIKVYKALSKDTALDNIEELIDQHLSDIANLNQQDIIIPEEKSTADEDNIGEQMQLVEITTFKDAKLVKLSGFGSSSDLSDMITEDKNGIK